MLRQRIITALILAPLLLWVLLGAPSAVTTAVIAAVIVLGAWEWSRFCGWTHVVLRLAYAACVGAAMFATTYVGSTERISLIWIITLLWWVGAFIWLALAPEKVSSSMAALAGFFVLVPTWLALGALQSTRGYLLFLLVLIFAADIGAYFAGRTFGRLKLAPRVSPGKTWEGVLGGLTSATIVAIVGAFWFKLTLSSFVALCLAVTIISIVGDLTESMFKRHVGLKDSSGLLPGHGGILDRIDSITAAAPLFALGLVWLGELA